ncbi:MULTISPECIES: alpha/beta hydrolase [unclassified Streptomyces]|uniref:alpha/beta hydrolase n=1 Tax=unclassified Streptomyces TaxID=2593676 RepID=UPI0036F55579
MTREQREQVRELRRNSPLDLGGDLDVQRPLFEQILSSQPVPTDAIVEKLDLAGVAALSVTISGAPQPVGTALYFHGGAFALGSANSSLGLVTQIARRSGLRVVTVDYRLAPEHPAPAAATDAATCYQALLDSGIGADELIVIGESAGGGVALRLLTSLVAGNRPVPAGAVLLSPWVDLTLTGDSMTTRASVDVAVNREALARRVLDYAGEGAAAAREHSPLFDDLHGLPPTLVQVGTHETLLDDSIRLASRLAAADVSVILDITAEVPHVFQGFAPILDEGALALDRAGQFVRTALKQPARDLLPG